MHPFRTDMEPEAHTQGLQLRLDAVLQHGQLGGGESSSRRLMGRGNPQVAGLPRDGAGAASQQSPGPPGIVRAPSCCKLLP